MSTEGAQPPVEPARVLFVIDGLGRGGAEQSLAEVAGPLRDRGIELTITFSHRREGQASWLRAEGFELIQLTGSTIFKRGVQLRRLVRERRPDLVHATLVTSTLLARIALIRTGVPILTSLVNTTYSPPAPLGQRGWRRLVIRTLDGWTGRHINTAFHAITASVADDAARNLGIDREVIHVVGRGRSRARLGWPSAERRARERIARGCDPADDLLVCVGRQEHQKGHTTLIEAWPAIMAGRPSARLVLAGRRGHAPPELEAALAALPAETRARVELPGHVHDIGGLLAAADLFLFPSLHEGIGGAAIEALALGLPIVASDLDVLREYLSPEVNAVLVPAGQPEAWAAAVLALLASPERRAAMSKENVVRFEERFTIDAVADQMATLYRHVCYGSR